jgi:UDP-N-acetylglucosamine 2-epimerase (non-hydrolysing)
MKQARVAVVMGTRPEAVKLAPLVLALGRQPGLSALVVTTGQHPGLVEEVLGFFGIAADADLSVAEAGPDLDAIAAAVLARCGGLLRAERPAAVAVQGDTTSVLGAALAAFYQRIPVAHLEAGLRSGDRLAPFPEEIHRRATTLVADLHFAPTAGAAARLVAEGVDPATVYLTGNTVIDALRLIRSRRFGYRDRGLAAVEAGRLAGGGQLMLVTAHRRESWGEPMQQIVRAVGRIAADRPAVMTVVALHPNPVVREAFAPLAGLGNVLLTDAEPYGSFVRLMDLADLILTDSGGIQEEASSLGTPVLVLRDVTERREGVRAGVARLVGTGADDIAAAAGCLLDNPAALAAMALPGDLYGDGRAAARCAAALAAHLAVTPG